MVKNLFLFSIAYIGTIIFTPIVVAFNSIRKAYRNESVSRYLKDAAIGFDQAGGSVLYQQENFTISSYTYFLCKYKNNQYACKFMKLIDFIFGKKHCKRAYEWEIRNDRQDLMQFTKDI